MTTTIEETAADRLRSAVKRVRGGWTRGTMCDEFGNYCPVGAILYPDTIIYRERASDEAGEGALDALYTEVIDRFDADELPAPGVPKVDVIAWWNDVMATDVEEVVSVMEAAVSRCEEADAVWPAGDAQ